MTFSVGLFADGTDAVTVTGITRPGHDGRVILNSATSSFPLVFFKPQIGSKLVSNLYMDMGQGFLECLHEIFNDE